MIQITNYLENFFVYFKEFKNKIIFKIIIIIFEIVIFFIYKYCCFLTIKLLSPIHVIFSFPILFFIKKFALPIFTEIKERSFFSKNHIGNIVIKYILDLIGDFISIIGFLIYLEIIELKFCGFNYNIRKSIFSRSEEEFSEKNISFVFLDNGDVDEVSEEDNGDVDEVSEEDNNSFKNQKEASLN